jgi:hypothetical protein
MGTIPKRTLATRSTIIYMPSFQGNEFIHRIEAVLMILVFQDVYF